MKAATSIAIVYSICFILTFGHAFHRVRVDYEMQRAPAAIFCGVAWPLYWSAHLMEPKKEQP